MIYGYARCSTNEDKQDIMRQVRELKSSGAQEVFLEYEHGDAAVKKELALLLDAAAEGDTIITTEVSRLSRSVKQLCDIIEVVSNKRLRLVIKDSITVDCTSGLLDPMTKAFLEISSVFAELELGIIRARIKSGMVNAKAKGKRIGRPKITKNDIPETFFKHYYAYKNNQLNISEFARVCNLSRNTIYRYLEMVGD